MVVWVMVRNGCVCDGVAGCGMHDGVDDVVGGVVGCGMDGVVDCGVDVGFW